MKQQIKSLKLNLKEIAHTIRNQKTVRKLSHPHHDKYLGDYALLRLRQEFRIKHIAYCLARGRTLEQIDSGVGVDMDAVNWLLKAMSPESTEKLYVVVNEKLTPSQQAVQSAHAVAEFLKQYPNTVWSNGYLVLLKDKPNAVGNMVPYIYGDCDIAKFIEPDLGNTVTAYAAFGRRVSETLKSKQLL